MSHRGVGRGLKPYGGSHRRPFPVDSGSDLDEGKHVRLPEIDPDSRELKARRLQKSSVQFENRIPLPERNHKEDRKHEPRLRGFNDLNPEHFNSSSGLSERNERKSRINGVKRVKFYRNGDKHFKGVEMVVSKQRYRSMDAIIEELSKAIPLPYGVRTIFTPGGSTISNIHQLQDGRYYICSSGDHLIRNVIYGKKKESVRSIDSERLSDASISTVSSSSVHSKISSSFNGNRKPRVITVISERDKYKMNKVLLNRKTVKSFEDVLKDISEMLRYSVKVLYTLQGVKVGRDFSCLKVF